MVGEVSGRSTRLGGARAPQGREPSGTPGQQGRGPGLSLQTEGGRRHGRLPGRRTGPSRPPVSGLRLALDSRARPLFSGHSCPPALGGAETALSGRPRLSPRAPVIRGAEGAPRGRGAGDPAPLPAASPRLRRAREGSSEGLGRGGAVRRGPDASAHPHPRLRRSRWRRPGPSSRKPRAPRRRPAG